jgi:hypothetical protein
MKGEEREKYVTTREAGGEKENGRKKEKEAGRKSHRMQEIQMSVDGSDLLISPGSISS